MVKHHLKPLAEKLLTTSDLAERWQVTEKTVREMCAAGRGPVGMKIGGQWRFNPGDVAKFEEGQKA